MQNNSATIKNPRINWRTSIGREISLLCLFLHRLVHRFSLQTRIYQSQCMLLYGWFQWEGREAFYEDRRFKLQFSLLVESRSRKDDKPRCKFGLQVSLDAAETAHTSRSIECLPLFPWMTPNEPEWLMANDIHSLAIIPVKKRDIRPSRW